MGGPFGGEGAGEGGGTGGVGGGGGLVTRIDEGRHRHTAGALKDTRRDTGLLVTPFNVDFLYGFPEESLGSAGAKEAIYEHHHILYDDVSGGGALML